MTTLISFGNAGPNGMENNIAFYVNGKSADRAADVILKININNPAQRSEAFERLSATTSALFRVAGASVPPQLASALSTQTPASSSTDIGIAELIHEPGRIDSYKVKLTDAREVAAQSARKSASASDSDACKVRVAEAAGYADSYVSGDGDPIQESGYKSFMFNGRGKDMFFCEIHPNRRFKIKAAIGGAFPFKYIAEGSL